MRGDYKSFARSTIPAQRECKELGMGVPPVGYKALEAVADVVLAYRPKSKQPKPHKRKKTHGCACCGKRCLRKKELCSFCEKAGVPNPILQPKPRDRKKAKRARS